MVIPQLPDKVGEAVANAYLLCRILDTIEDEPGLKTETKKQYAKNLLQLLEGGGNPEVFAMRLARTLSTGATEYERELVRALPDVLERHRSLEFSQRRAILRCLNIMAKGMMRFQHKASRKGLADMAELEGYCYCVAGVVGEMLTELFCLYSPAIAHHKSRLMERAVAFGQGLQITNILKDFWEDYEAGYCWLPRSEFAESGLHPEMLKSKKTSTELQQGVRKLVGVALANLSEAKDYVLLIPPDESGIRRFLLWMIGMAVHTLRKITDNLHYTDGETVKISRKGVKATMISANIVLPVNFMISAWYSISCYGLPAPPGDYRQPASAVIIPYGKGRHEAAVTSWE